MYIYNIYVYNICIYIGDFLKVTEKVGLSGNRTPTN